MMDDRVLTIDGQDVEIPRKTFLNRAIFVCSLFLAFFKFLTGSTSTAFSSTPSWVAALIASITDEIGEEVFEDDDFKQKWSQFRQGARIELRYRRNHAKV